MQTAEYDLGYLQAGVEILENYILSDAVYWPIGTKPPAGDPPYPQLTLEWLLLAEKRAQARLHTAPEKLAFDQLRLKIEAIRSHWRVNWENKAAAEFSSRLKLWRDFLEDYRKNPGENYDRYPYEINRRVLLEILEKEARGIPDYEMQMLAGLDRILDGILLPGDFVWDPELQDAFSRQPYWYLYGMPSSEG